MSMMKEQAIELLRDLPDDKIVYIIDILRGIKGLLSDEKSESDFSNTRPRAMGILSKYANADLVSQEKEAWGKAVIEKRSELCGTSYG